MNIFSRLSISILTIVVTLIVYLLLQLTPLRIAENFYEDLLVTTTSAGLVPSNEIVVVEVQESTLAGFPYRSPLDREFLARLINKLIDADARAVGLDILFDQPSEAEKDGDLKSALLRGKEIVFAPRATAESGLSGKQLTFQEQFLANLQTTSIVFAKDRNDGIVRHYLADQLVDGGRLQQLSAAMAGNELGKEPGKYRRVFYQSDTKGNPHKFNTYPAEAALLLPAEWFRGKYVLVGKNIASVDQFRTSFISAKGEELGVLPGVQVHAHILNQLLSDREIVETHGMLKLAGMLLAGFAGVWLVLLHVEVWIRSVLVMMMVAAVLLAGYLVFSSAFILLPMLAVALSLLVSSLLMSGLKWQRDRSQKLFIRQAWSHYVSENVVDTLIADPGSLKLGGQRVEASFIFTDIEGFTKLSEDLSPEKLTTIINAYLDLMTEEFRKANATLDKIVGDAIVGFIGAPLDDTDHANKAVSLSLRLSRVSDRFREDMRKKGIQLGKTRIGVNTGFAVVGNFGGSHFFDYTALGDAVNIAARLEGANKKIGSSICVSGETARSAKGHIFRPIGQLYVEGKANKVEAWEPVSEGDTHLADISEYQSAYEKLENDVRTAKSSFQSLREKYPSDHLVKFHLNRLESKQTGTEIEITK